MEDSDNLYMLSVSEYGDCYFSEVQDQASVMEYYGAKADQFSDKPVGNLMECGKKRYCLIRGRIVTPKPVETVTKYVIE
jgi:hypothetical protein